MYLQPITYYEWLSWKNKSDYDTIFKQSSYNRFIEFIKTGTSNIISNPNDYIRSVVIDTCELYKMRANTGQIALDEDFDNEKFNNILNYMALTSLAKKESNGKYTKPQKFLYKYKEVIKRANAIISNYQKIISNYKNEDIRKYLQILTSSGLVNNHRQSTDSLDGEYWVFRYPQYIYEIAGSNVLDANIFFSVIIENLLIDAVSNYYDYASKYRDVSQREFDICYSTSSGCYGIEIKCRPLNKINIDWYKSVVADTKLDDIAFTAYDIVEPVVIKSGKYILRPDILMLVYEIAYTQNNYNKISLSELLKEFKLI